MEQLIAEQTAEIQELQGDFSNAQQLMEQKYRMLNERFSEITELYDQRPARPEDLELIQTLQEEILAKENAIKKAAEDMKFYKLELINREQSYNAMFGANPNVGLIQPQQQRLQKQTAQGVLPQQQKVTQKPKAMAI